MTRCGSRWASGSGTARRLQVRVTLGPLEACLLDSLVVPTYDVLALGNAIVDVMSHASDEFLIRHDLKKDTMELVEAERADLLYAAMGPTIETSGGSAANTAVGVAALGGRAAFIGKVRDDQLGNVFTHDIRAAGVAFDVPPAVHGPPTARSLIVVTP